jgi:hypothetical protein
MKEFWKKHHWAIIATGGVLILLYIFYEYEQAQAAANANSTNAADNAAAQLAAEELPLVSGSGGGVSLGSSPTGASSGGSGINNYTNTPTPTTASLTPSTSSSGLPNSSPGNAPTQAASPTISIPGSGTAPGSPYNPNPGTTNAQDQALYAAAKAANAASFCYDAAPGLAPTPGLSACGPGGGGSASNLGTMVSGLLPGQTGYTSALESEIQADQTANPQAVAGLQEMLQQYGGYDTSAESTGAPGGGAPAGSTQTGASNPPQTPKVSTPIITSSLPTGRTSGVNTTPVTTNRGLTTTTTTTTPSGKGGRGVTPQPVVTPVQNQQAIQQNADLLQSFIRGFL